MRLTRFSPRFYTAAIVFILIVLFGFLGPYLLTSRTPTSVVGGLYDKPSGGILLGTDNVGHDVFAQLIYGTRTSLIVGLVAGVAATLIGVIIGTAAGYLGGLIEDLLMAFTNIIVAIPTYVVLILIAIALHTRSATGVAIVIAATTWPWTARAVRAQATSIRTREHLDIARLSGANSFTIVIYDVIPYMLSYIVMAFVLQVSSAILTEAALSLLGLGPSNGVSLGTMLHWALSQEAVRTGAWWAFVPPTLVLTLIAFSLLMLQSSMDELFNPRLRRGSTKLRWSAAPAPSLAAAGAPEVVPVATGPAAPIPAEVTVTPTAPNQAPTSPAPSGSPASSNRRRSA
jgi:peptide/nickel transport system permease protein